MADRVYPGDSSDPADIPAKPTLPVTEKPVPPPAATYVIQIPKDQVYRIPPPENATRYKNYTKSKRRHRRPCCCCCLYPLLAVIVGVVVLAGLSAGIFYLVFRPESPDYSFESIAIKGLNVTSSSPSMVSPEFDVTLRYQNPNDKIGIYYEKDSSVEVFYSNILFCDGFLPAFYQPSNNVTVLRTALKGSRIQLASPVRKALVDGQKQGKVPFRLELRAPVKFKVGSVKTWTIRVKVTCDVTVDKLTARPKIVKKDCDHGVDLW